MKVGAGRGRGGRISCRGRLAVIPALLAGALLQPVPAAAHLVTTGMGPVYDGIGHLLLTPEDLVPALALALYAGLRGAAAGRSAMFLLPLSWFVGGLAGSAPGMTIPPFPLPALSLLGFGALVAADLALPAAAVAGLAILLGASHGFLNGVVLRGGAGASGLVGISAVLFVLVALASALVVALRSAWMRVAVRVAGSWIAAVGLLMLGWALRGPAG